MQVFSHHSRHLKISETFSRGLECQIIDKSLLITAANLPFSYNAEFCRKWVTDVEFRKVTRGNTAAPETDFSPDRPYDVIVAEIMQS